MTSIKYLILCRWFRSNRMSDSVDDNILWKEKMRNDMQKNDWLRWTISKKKKITNHDWISFRQYSNVFMQDFSILIQIIFFEFREQELAFVDFFSFDIDTSVALETISFWNIETDVCWKTRIRLRLYSILVTNLPNEWMSYNQWKHQYSVF